MSDTTVTEVVPADTATTTAVQNEAIPTSVTATPVDTATTNTETINTETINTDTLASITTSSIISSDSALISASITLSTSSFRSSTTGPSIGNPFTELPPFLTATGARPPFPSGSAPPFFFGGNNGNGLSTGAKAGIGVGVAALALSVIAVALLILRMRKKEEQWKAANAPNLAPPPYQESAASSTNVVEMQSTPMAKAKHAPSPLMLNTREASSSNPSHIAPVLPLRSVHRKSKASLRPRRNSNLAPVSEEEPVMSGSNLALVSEHDDGASITAPPTPRTPRTVALHQLTGETGAPSPIVSSFNLEPVPPVPSGNLSPNKSEFDRWSGR